MKKLMMLAAMLALVAAVGTVPALAQSSPFDDGPFAQEERSEDHPFKNFFGEDFFERFFNHDDEDEADDNNDDIAVDTPSVDLSSEQEAQSGDFPADFSVGNTGDYANQCVPAIQFGNTGNFNNAPSFVQVGSESGDFEPGGIEVSFAPEMEVRCSSEVQQSSAASSDGYYYGY